MLNEIQIATTKIEIANKFWQNPRWHIYCFDCEKALRPFAFNKGAILPSIDYGAAAKLEIIYIGKVPWTNWTLTTSITVPSFWSCL